jgi:hypothetical protein
MFKFRFKEDDFKGESSRQAKNFVDCDVLPNFKPVSFKSVENSLLGLK